MKNAYAKIKIGFLKLKLKQKVRLLFASIMVAYFLLFAFLYIFVLKGNINNYIEGTNYNTMVSIGNSLNSDFENISTMGQLILNNQEILSYLRGNDGMQSVEAYNAVASIYSIATSFKNIASVYVFKKDGDYIDIANGITRVNKEIMNQESWYESVKQGAGANVIMINGGGAFVRQSGKPVVSFVRIINDVKTQKPVGILVINCSIELLEATYQEMTDSDKQFAYYDKDNRLLAGDNSLHTKIPSLNSKDNFRALDQGANRKSYYYLIPNAPLIVAEYENVNYFKYFGTQSVLLVALIILVTIFSFWMISFFIKYVITDPMERLIESMDEVKSGWFKRVSIQLPDDEMGRLKNSYNNMLVEINRLIEELLEKEKNMQHAELEALQEQIKPHFLYNTLDMIAYLALEESRESVYDAIETLGNFYRKFLSKGSKEISLQEEVDIIKDYLKLQKLRYEDILEDEYNIENSLKNLKIPKLILQPLVENSLYHGIRLKGEKGLIRISAREEETYIGISVYDTGIGMTSEQINKFMEEDSKSFGLRKTIERIQCHYGISDVYEVHSVEGYYCEILIKIPKEKVISHV